MYCSLISFDLDRESVVLGNSHFGKFVRIYSYNRNRQETVGNAASITRNYFPVEANVADVNRQPLGDATNHKKQQWQWSRDKKRRFQGGDHEFQDYRQNGIIKHAASKFDHGTKGLQVSMAIVADTSLTYH